MYGCKWAVIVWLTHETYSLVDNSMGCCLLPTRCSISTESSWKVVCG